MDHLGYYYSPFDWLLIVVTTTYPIDARGFLLLIGAGRGCKETSSLALLFKGTVVMSEA